MDLRSFAASEFFQNDVQSGLDFFDAKEEAGTEINGHTRGHPRRDNRGLEKRSLIGEKSWHLSEDPLANQSHGDSGGSATQDRSYKLAALEFFSGTHR